MVKTGELNEREKKERKIIRKILGPKQVDGQITHTMKKRRVMFYGHLKRMDSSRISKLIFDIFDQRPKTNLKWFQATKKDMHEMNIDKTQYWTEICSEMQ